MPWTSPSADSVTADSVHLSERYKVLVWFNLGLGSSLRHYFARFSPKNRSLVETGAGQHFRAVQPRHTRQMTSDAKITKYEHHPTQGHYCVYSKFRSSDSSGTVYEIAVIQSFSRNALSIPSTVCLLPTLWNNSCTKEQPLCDKDFFIFITQRLLATNGCLALLWSLWLHKEGYFIKWKTYWIILSILFTIQWFNCIFS